MRVVVVVSVVTMWITIDLMRITMWITIHFLKIQFFANFLRPLFFVS